MAVKFLSARVSYDEAAQNEEEVYGQPAVPAPSHERAMIHYHAIRGQSSQAI
jgi:hypothetical protein